MKDYDKIPEMIKQLPQWVCHRNTMPFNPVTSVPAKVGIPNTWARFEDAVNTYDKSGYDGVGFEYNNNVIAYT